MKGDYNRYIAEYAQADLKEKVGQDAAESYRMATESAPSSPDVWVILI